MPLTPEQYERAQPKFKPSHEVNPGQSAEGLMIHAEGILPANVPGQRGVGILKDPENPGHRIEVSVPHLPYERWIDAAGTVCSCVVRTNRVQKKNGKGSTDDGNYRDRITRAYIGAGWVRYDDGLGMPNGTEWTPVFRDKLIADRQKDQADVMRYEERTWLDKRKRESESVQKALTDALTTFADGAKQRAARTN